LTISEVEASKAMFPNGQAGMQSLQRTQRSTSTSMAPVAPFLGRASTGQTLAQAASSHCMHRIGMFSVSENEKARTRERAGIIWRPWDTAHASSHVRHPVQRDGVTTSVPPGLAASRTGLTAASLTCRSMCSELM
jgi:hypothetical protein